MKRKKSQSIKPLILTQQEAWALTRALDFLSHAYSFSYDGKGFTYKAPFNAAEKLDEHDYKLTQPELLAVSHAINLVLRAMSLEPGLIHEVSEEYPDLIPDIESCYPLLKELSKRFPLP